MIKVLAEATGTDPAHWHDFGAAWKYGCGYGGPSWHVERKGAGWTVVYYECGWYEQRGDAGSVEALSQLMRAMVAAQTALDEALAAGKEVP